LVAAVVVVVVVVVVVDVVGGGVSPVDCPITVAEAANKAAHVTNIRRANAPEGVVSFMVRCN
jgi:hypothetical protein